MLISQTDKTAMALFVVVSPRRIRPGRSRRVKTMSDKKENFSIADGIKMFATLSIWIVWPLLVAIFLGRLLDARNNSGQFWFYALMAIGFVVSIVGLVVNALKEFKDIDKK